MKKLRHDCKCACRLLCSAVWLHCSGTWLEIERPSEATKVSRNLNTLSRVAHPLPSTIMTGSPEPLVAMVVLCPCLVLQSFPSSQPASFPVIAQSPFSALHFTICFFFSPVKSFLMSLSLLLFFYNV